ncbi:MAG: hypothetical protein IJZ72_08095 [Oscillospiraceae bacterium]|nr:hypothetical protein [Oscillospiraceae bacterium]
MQLLFTGITFAALIICFFFDYSGKLNKLGAIRGFIYILFIYAFSFALSSSINNLEYNLEPARYGDFSDFITKSVDWNELVKIIIQSCITFIAVSLSIIAAAAVMRRELKKSITAGNLHRNMRLVVACTFSEMLAGIVSIILAATALIIGTGIVSSELLALIVIALLIVILTLGMAIPIVIIALPIYIVGIGIDAIIRCFPFISMSIIWGICFLITHIISLVFTVCILRKCRTENLISKPKAITFGILQAIPLVNIISSIILKSQIKKSANY